MRILVVSNYYPPLEIGGQEQHAADVVSQLQARGHAVHVLTSRTTRPPETAPAHVAGVLHLESPDVVHYHPRYTLARRFRDAENRRTLAAALAGFEADVIFIWGMWNLSRDLARYAEQLRPHRVVYYVASPWPTEANPHVAYWSAPAARAVLRPPKRWLGKIARRLLLRGVPGSLPAFRHVLCVSDFMRRYMVHEVGVPPAQVSVVYNGIDLREFPERPARQGRAEPLRLLYVGGLFEHKGVHVAIEAVGHLTRDLGIHHVHLTLVGGGHPAYVQQLRRRVATLGIEPYVTFAGRVSRDRIPGWLHQHDVLLFPSVWAEPLARTVQEAMACGLVVIGTATGGTPEILFDGETGVAVQPGDARELAAKICEVAGDAALRMRLIRAARRLVEDRFTLARHVDEIERHLAQVCGTSRS